MSQTKINIEKVSCPVFWSHYFPSSYNSRFLLDSSSGTKNENKGMFEVEDDVGADGKSDGHDGHILRHFFDDWPGSLQEPDNAESNASSINSATCLSISITGNTSSDVSLKLSTGNGEHPCPGNGNVASEQPQLNWAAGWTSANQMASMGGPLAEALRSSTSTSSPTSVLRQLPHTSVSETSFIST